MASTTASRSRHPMREGTGLGRCACDGGDASHLPMRPGAGHLRRPALPATCGVSLVSGDHEDNVLGPSSQGDNRLRTHGRAGRKVATGSLRNRSELP